MIIKNVTIRTRKGGVLAGVVYAPKQVRQTVILSHGFGADKDGPSGLFHKLGIALCKKDFCVIRYDFQSAGTRGGVDVFDMLQDMEAVALYARRFSEQVVLVGHSLGGLVSLMVAPRTRGVQGLVLWSPPLALHLPKNWSQFMQRYRVSWGKALYLMARYMFSHQRFRAESYFRKLRVPVLLLYGDADQFSEYEDMDALRKFPNVDVVKIPGLDHYYSAFQQETVARTVAWIEEKCKQ